MMRILVIASILNGIAVICTSMIARCCDDKSIPAYFERSGFWIFTPVNPCVIACLIAVKDGIIPRGVNFCALDARIAGVHVVTVGRITLCGTRMVCRITFADMTF